MTTSGTGPGRSDPIDSSDRDVILAVNSGSSSLKIGLFGRGESDEQLLISGLVENIGRADCHLRVTDSTGKVLAEKSLVVATQPEALSELVELSRDHLPKAPSAVGHRIVHGGPELLEHQLITADVLQKLQDAVHFAPLHIPAAVELVKRTEVLFPGVPTMACFDTAFHRYMPTVAKRFAIPAKYDRAGLHRYGFHGLSYESAVHRLADRIPERTIVAHLGNGSSLCAMRWGHPVHTTMGLTPTGGIPMATRSGDLDPGVLLFLMRTQQFGADELEALLNRESGLLALSGGESDMRQLLQRSGAGDRVAQLAVEAYVHGVRMAIGAYASLLCGLDLLVFTGGIGEHSAEIRGSICRGMEFVGLSDDPACERVMILTAEEERQIARICRSHLLQVKCG